MTMKTLLAEDALPPSFGMGARERNREELEAAKLLLSVSPTCRPMVRPRSLSLDALCDVALGDNLVPGGKDPAILRISPSSSSSPLSHPSSILSSLKRNSVPMQDDLESHKRTRRSTRFSNSNSTGASPKMVGAYTLEERKERIARFVEKRNARVWVKKVRYSCRKNLAQCRMRVKGRFVSSKGQDDEVDSL